MPRRNRKLDDGRTKNAIIKRYNNNERLQDIADIYGVSRLCIQSRLLEWEISQRPRWRQPAHIRENKDYGYGSWEVTCPDCKETRIIRAHKYVDGKIRGENALCFRCAHIKRRTDLIEITCPQCKIRRHLKPTEAKQRLTDYCKHCKPGNRGEATAGYLGGNRRLTSRGYVTLIGLKGHPLASGKHYVLEHRLVFWENTNKDQKVLDLMLSGKATIHHRNGIKNDNGPENLELRLKHPHGNNLDDWVHLAALTEDGRQKMQEALDKHNEH